jgi:ankyrin repeat protein
MPHNRYSVNFVGDRSIFQVARRVIRQDAGVLVRHLSSRDVRGRTMSHRTECAAILLEAGAELSPRDKEGNTPLEWAIRNELPDMVEFLRRN